MVKPRPDAGRLELLYRFASGSTLGRALELTTQGDPILRSTPSLDCTLVNVRLPALRSRDRYEFTDGDHNSLCCVADYGNRLPFANGSFDAVVLHRVLDDVADMERRNGREFDLQLFLSGLWTLLRDGGTIAGCVANRHSIADRYRRMKGLFDRSKVFARSTATVSVNQCQAALASAGFQDIHLFSMLPDSTAPHRLLSIDRRWSRQASKRYVDGLRPMLDRSRFIGWRLFAELGVTQYLGRAIFFIARKQC